MAIRYTHTHEKPLTETSAAGLQPHQTLIQHHAPPFYCRVHVKPSVCNCRALHVLMFFTYNYNKQ